MRHEEISLATKKALSEALKKAMESKPFQKITVSELIKECDINRKTFYYHFEDIYALLKWTLEEEAIEVVKHFDLLVDYEEAITFIMDYIEQNRYMLNCAYDSIGRDELRRFLFTDCHEITISIINYAEKEAGTNLEEGYKEFLELFYSEAIAGIIIERIKNPNDRDRKTGIRYISNTIIESLLAIVKNSTVK